jgi:hypothetical protein
MYTHTAKLNSHLSDGVSWVPDCAGSKCTYGRYVSQILIDATCMWPQYTSFMGHATFQIALWQWFLVPHSTYDIPTCRWGTKESTEHQISAFRLIFDLLWLVWPNCWPQYRYPTSETFPPCTSLQGQACCIPIGEYYTEQTCRSYSKVDSMVSNISIFGFYVKLVV